MNPAVLTPYRPLVIAATLLLIVAALTWARAVFIPIALALFLTACLTPFVVLLQRYGLRRGVAVGLVVFATLLVLGSLLTLLSMQLHQLAVELPSHRQELARKIQDLRGTGPSVVGNLTSLFADLSKELSPSDPGKSTIISVAAEKPTGWNLLVELAGSAAGALGSAVLIVALTVSILLKREDMRNRLMRLIGHGHLTSATRALEEAGQRISRYLLTQLLINVGYGIAFGIGLFIIGIPQAFLWGVLATVLRYVPFVGSVLPILVPLLISIAGEGWVKPALLVGYVIVLAIVTSNLVEQFYIQRSTGISPIALVLSAAFWAWVWGPVGIVLATPITVCLSVLGRHVPALQFFDILLGPEAGLAPHLSYYQRLLAEDEGEAEELVEDYLTDHDLAELCDQVFIPSLIQAKVDRERGLIEPAELNAMTTTTTTILATVAAVPELDEEVAAARVAVVGYAAHDDRAEVGLDMLERLLHTEVALTVLGTTSVVTDVVAAVKASKPIAVVVGNVPPRSPAQARLVCKRLRTLFPQLQIIVGCWGVADAEQATLSAELRRAGANQVAFSLTATTAMIRPLLPLAGFKSTPSLAGQGVE
jgi:predicted PurR-regulated permease PerM